MRVAVLIRRVHVDDGRAEIGLAPLQAMQSIAVINGRATLWGDALVALVQKAVALPGDRVRKGDLILQLDPREAALARAQAPGRRAIDPSSRKATPRSRRSSSLR